MLITSLIPSVYFSMFLLLEKYSSSYKTSSLFHLLYTSNAGLVIQCRDTISTNTSLNPCIKPELSVKENVVQTYPGGRAFSNARLSSYYTQAEYLSSRIYKCVSAVAIERHCLH